MYVLQYIIYTWVYMDIYIYNIMYICIYIIEYNIIYYNIYIYVYIYTIYVYVSIGAPASSSFGQSKSKPCHALHLTIMWNCIYFLKYVEKYMTSSTYGMPYILLLNHQLLYVSLYVVFAFFNICSVCKYTPLTESQRNFIGDCSTAARWWMLGQGGAPPVTR